MEAVIKTSDKGKPGESRGRKANGSKVTQVTMTARPPKIKHAHSQRGEPGSLQAFLFQ